ncbi:CAP domain-containing protein [Nannocystis sp. ILAH1]|uniref:CAP domain-containing protein n=1 Tax=unclassified Nannocystis TaxID=2627009 RepID=UPI00226DEB40|nr:MULTISPECIES: CAP domain-containing protein [unclassified Nannocystis]MCY0991464.1 CAP domain-containing protein [Nannocystis sp. ILAH1]MCY1066513.1 CAP domain-containing protein [Nannocystis sp. RBIL2]
MLSSLRVSAVVLAVLFAGCYSGIGADETAPISGSTDGGGGGTQIGESGGDSDGGSGGSMSGTQTDPGTTTDEDATTSPAVTTGGGPATDTTPTTGPDVTTGPDPGTGTTNDPSAGTTDPGTTSTSTTGEPANPDVPDGVPYCEPAKGWDPAWKQLEEDVLVLVNQRRAEGANCGAEGTFGPAGPLTMDPALRCAARMHSKDMNDRAFFDHTNPDGEPPWDRMGKAGYGNYSNAGENIAGGSPDAAGTMDQWMNSAGHCANIMNPDFEHIGVGYYPGGEWGHLWTQVFGAK